MKKSFKVYGFNGHRNAASFGDSMSFERDGIKVEFLCSDKTGTNDYVVVIIEAETEDEIMNELYGQIDDGMFENCRTGKVEEI